MTNQLDSLEQTVVNTGLTHSTMLEFFKLIPTNDSTAILPTYAVWVQHFRDLGVAVDEVWYERMVTDYTLHGRLTAETLISADPAPVVEIGDDPDAN